MPLRSLGAPRRVAVADELQHRLTPDEAIAVAALEAQEVRAAVVPVDRRPEEEDLRQRDLGRGGRRLADRPHAPRTVLGAVDALDRDLARRRPTMRPVHVPHCVSRVESITVLVPAVDRLARLFERDRARGERDVGVDAEIGGVGAHARDAQRLDDVDRQRADARLRRGRRGCDPTRTPSAARRRARPRTRRR